MLRGLKTTKFDKILVAINAINVAFVLFVHLYFINCFIAVFSLVYVGYRYINARILKREEWIDEE